VGFDEILFLEAGDNYVVFVLEGNRKLASRLTMQEAEALLPPERFVRIHRSYLVARARVERFDRYDVLVAGHTLPIDVNFQENVGF